MDKYHRHNSVGHTAAWLDPLLVYDQDQIDLFGTPRDVENWFVKATKRTYVGHDYIQQLESLMKQIHQIVLQAPNTKPFSDYETSTAKAIRRYESETEFEFFCDVVRIKIDVVIPLKTMRLAGILVRPCAAKLGIFRLFLWQLVNSCKLINWNLMILEPVQVTQNIVDGIDKLFVYNDFKHRIILSNQDMDLLSIDSFRLGNRLLSQSPVLKLNPSAFPGNNYLNFGPLSQVSHNLDAQDKDFH
jgi:hypothetical protein